MALAVLADPVGWHECVEQVTVKVFRAGGEAASATKDEWSRQMARAVPVSGGLVVDLPVGCGVVIGDEHLAEVNGEVVRVFCLVAAGASVLGHC